MGILKKSIQKVAEDSCTLQATKLITENDKKHNVAWAKLAEEYDEMKDQPWMHKALASLLNAIVFQQRKAFILTRNSLRKLLQSDENWEGRLGLKNESYPAFIRAASDLIEVVEKVVNAKGRTVFVYRVKNEEVLALLEADTATQIKECVALIQTVKTETFTEDRRKKRLSTPATPPNGSDLKEVDEFFAKSTDHETEDQTEAEEALELAEELYLIYKDCALTEDEQHAFDKLVAFLDKKADLRLEKVEELGAVFRKSA